MQTVGTPRSAPHAAVCPLAPWPCRIALSLYIRTRNTPSCVGKKTKNFESGHINRRPRDLSGFVTINLSYYETTSCNLRIGAAWGGVPCPSAVKSFFVALPWTSQSEGTDHPLEGIRAQPAFLSLVWATALTGGRDGRIRLPLQPSVQLGWSPCRGQAAYVGLRCYRCRIAISPLECFVTA
jgi:hypothetical protein